MIEAESRKLLSHSNTYVICNPKEVDKCGMFIFTKKRTGFVEYVVVPGQE